MKNLMKVVSVLAMLVIVLCSHWMASAQPPATVTGGGTANPDGLTQFGFGVSGDSGHFTCLMAGRFTNGGFIDCPGSDCVMIVQGRVTSLDSVNDTAASFSGEATVILSKAYQEALGLPRIVRNVGYAVDVTEGGASVATLQLNIFGLDIPGSPGVVNSGNIVIQP